LPAFTLSRKSKELGKSGGIEFTTMPTADNIIGNLGSINDILI